MSNRTWPSKVLITRAEANCSEIITELQTLGHNVIHEPIIDIVFCAENKKVSDDIQTILITSVNAITALTKLSAKRNVAILCVGKTTTATAQKLGFKKVIFAGSTSLELYNYVNSNHRPDAGKLIYLSGENIAFDLAEKLKHDGYKATRLVVYKAKAKENLSDNFINSWKNRSISSAFFYSKRSAKIFLSLLEKENLSTSTNKTDVFCLSQNVADVFSDIKGYTCYVAETPDQEALLITFNERR